ncbi:MAG TPA: hypothetical protein VFW33_11960, partial [Gemmataceae bacterium]|nr:hypothetical protein [Gemmataceae bacterium]
SSYLFYAVDQPVSGAGQRVAHRFSSRADVDEQFARYQKWGDYELSGEAYRALLGEHYDVMASESYDTWTLMIAVAKTPQMEQLLRPFHDLDDGEFVRLEVHDYRKRLAVEIHCEFDYEGALWNHHDDSLETLVELLAEIRADIIRGDVSFLQAVADFYGTEADEGADDEAEAGTAHEDPPADWGKARLQEECVRRGVAFRKSWTKDQLRQALASAGRAPLSRSRPPRGSTPVKLSRAARQIVDSLTRL